MSINFIILQAPAEPCGFNTTIFFKSHLLHSGSHEGLDQQQVDVRYTVKQNTKHKWKKLLREMQTLHAGCSKVEPKFFAPPQTPFPGAQDGQNLISWRWPLPLPTNPVWWRSMHAISSYRGNKPTNTRRPPQTGPITIHCAAKLSAQCKNRSATAQTTS